MTVGLEHRLYMKELALIHQVIIGQYDRKIYGNKSKDYGLI
jgi:hypothetical protein